jgi:3',5'-cyclic AMP phosphodiesterase CpdA
VHLGDITADGIEEPEQFETARAVLSKCGPPLRLIPGNHDIGDNPVPGLASGHALVDAGRLALYRRTFGHDRWATQASGWTLIGLNAQLFALGDAEEAAQFAWLEQTLAYAAGPVGLFLHKPLFRQGWEDDELHPRYVPLAPRRRLRSLFAGCDLRFVANGHTHQRRSLVVEGVEHLWAPSCAFVVPDLMQEWIGEKVVGAITLELGREAHRFAFHVPQGVARHDLADYADVFPKLRQTLAKAAAARGL